MRRISVRLDPDIDALLKRTAPPGKESAWVRTAIIEKAARDEMRGELAELRARVKRLERRVGLHDKGGSTP